MQRIRPINKFYRRYEVDLWGRLAGQKNNKTVRFFQKIQKEKFLKKRFNNSLRKKKHRTNQVHTKKARFLHNQKQKRRKNNKLKMKFSGTRYKAKRGKRRRRKVKKNQKRTRIRNKLRNQKRYFIYRTDYVNPERERAKTSLSRELFLVKNKLLRFYANIKKKQLRRYANTRVFKLKFKLIRGLGDQHLSRYNNNKIFKKLLALDAFFSLIEHRLDIMVYRSNFTDTIQQSRHFIKYGHVFVNGQCVTHCNYLLKNFFIVTMSPKLSYHRFKKLKINIQKKLMILYPPKYIYCDYTIMKSMLLFNPTTSKVPFPFKIDLSKWLGLAKHLF